MSLTVRRVVTGHDKNGRAIVAIDETAKNVTQGRPGAHAAVIWTSEGFPVDNGGDADTSSRKVGTTLDNGTVFRVVSFGPGVTPRNHRTDSIDYAVVMSGEIDMELDGESVHLKAGDVLVQRGTIHNWVNQGSRPCVIASCWSPPSRSRRRQGAQRGGMSAPSARGRRGCASRAGPEPEIDRRRVQHTQDDDCRRRMGWPRRIVLPRGGVDPEAYQPDQREHAGRADVGVRASRLR
jgi:mannose-6-phosphate isomerase-like protein (cupin superfamily)